MYPINDTDYHFKLINFTIYTNTILTIISDLQLTL